MWSLAFLQRGNKVVVGDLWGGKEVVGFPVKSHVKG